MSAYALGALPLAFVLYAAPIYLSHALGLSQTTLGRWLWLPPLGWEIGYFFWGFVADALPPESTVHGRTFTLLALCGLPLALVPSLTSLSVVMGVLVFAMFIAAGFIIMGISYATRAFSARESGLIAGIGAGSWSAAVAVTMPLFGRLFDKHQHGQAFVLAAAVPLVGVALWWAASTRLVREA
jgi:ACS family hexuronate transporter-like MFS transporter